jgi:hypothetical protein
MRYLKFLTGAASCTLIALVFSAGAFGDTICKANENPCSSGNAWALGTEIKATIKKGTEFHFDGARHYRCSGSSRTDVLAKNTVAAGPGVADQVTPKSEEFSGCISEELGTCTAVTGELPGGAFWLANAKSAGNGYAEPHSTAGTIKFNCSSGLNCLWLYREQISHTYKGGSPAIEYLKAQYVRSPESSFGCGIEVIVEGEREITSPSSAIYWSYG